MHPDVIKEKVEVHDTRLNDHGKRIRNLETKDAAQDARLENLCDKLEKQTRSIYILVGAILTALAGFFFYAVQTSIFYGG